MRALWTAGAEALPVSLAAMRRFPLRTALSVLGVVIGVAAVIAMLSVSEGGREAILRQVDRLGPRNLIVRDQNTREQRGAGLRLGDIEGIRRLVPEVLRTAAVVEQSARVVGPAGAIDAVVLGVTADYVPLRQLAVSSGRPLTALDRGEQRVCVIGATLSRTLFGGRDPIGQAVTIDRQWFTVVGVLGWRSDEGASEDLPLLSADHDTALLVPLPALDGHDRLMPDRRITQAWIEAAPQDDPLVVKPLVERALLALHRDRRDFDVVAPIELLRQRLEAQRVFNVVVGSIACLALLVGGIGIMNIMLASVLERTTEIGLRRTVGATQRWILVQFVLESVVLTAAGGVMGVLAGLAVTAAITMYAGWPVRVAPWAVVVSLGAAVAVGLVFGIYPAIRAARLQPIDAVRYE